MEVLVLLTSAVICVSCLQGYAIESPAEAYWKAKLGNTPMPKVVKNALQGAQGNVKDPVMESNKYDPIKVYNYGGGLSTTNTKNYDPAKVYYYGGGLLTRNTNNYDPTKVYNYGGGLSTTNTKNYDPTKVYNYGGGLSTTNSKNYDPTKVYNYGGGLSTTTSNNYDPTKVYNYGGGLSTTNTKNYDPTKVYNYGGGLSTTTSKNYDITKVYNYAGGLSTINSKNYDPTKAQVYEHSEFLNDDSMLFFLEKDILHPRGKMKLHFVKSDDNAKFLPLQIAKSIPLSYDKLSEILKAFSVRSDSADAKVIEKTIKICEARAVEGENKYCATSLEAMVDYVISNTGNKVNVFSTEIDKETMMEYKVDGAQKVSNGFSLACHKMPYPYALFYCHNPKNTDAYAVSLTGSNGKKLNATAVCHKYTSSWNHGHIAFQLLRVKPGSVPICHFQYEDSMILVPY